MVICHFFLRVIKKKTYLMCETSCSDGSTSPWTSPEVMFEIAPGETPADWAPRVRDRVAAAHPDHKLGDVAIPRRNGGPQTFDIALKKPAAPTGRGLLSRLTRK